MTHYQRIFLIKNLLSNNSFKNTNKETRILFNNCFYKENTPSKLEILTLMESFSLCAFKDRIAKANSSTLCTNDTRINRLMGLVRLYLNAYSHEELAFVLKTQLEIGVYDFFLLKHYVKTKINVSSLFEAKFYRIMYFNNEVDLSTADLDILNAYVKLTNHVRLEDPSIIESMCISVLKAVMEYLDEDKEFKRLSLDGILGYIHTSDGLLTKSAFQRCFLVYSLKQELTLDTAIFTLNVISLFDQNLYSAEVKELTQKCIAPIVDAISTKIINNTSKYTQIPIFGYLSSIFEKFNFKEPGIIAAVANSPYLGSNCISLRKYTQNTDESVFSPTIESLISNYRLKSTNSREINPKYDHSNMTEIFSSLTKFEPIFKEDVFELTQKEDLKLDKSDLISKKIMDSDLLNAYIYANLDGSFDSSTFSREETKISSKAADLLNSGGKSAFEFFKAQYLVSESLGTGFLSSIEKFRDFVQILDGQEFKSELQEEPVFSRSSIDLMKSTLNAIEPSKFVREYTINNIRQDSFSISKRDKLKEILLEEHSIRKQLECVALTVQLLLVGTERSYLIPDLVRKLKGKALSEEEIQVFRDNIEFENSFLEPEEVLYSAVVTDFLKEIYSLKLTNQHCVSVFPFLAVAKKENGSLKYVPKVYEDSKEETVCSRRISCYLNKTEVPELKI